MSQSSESSESSEGSEGSEGSESSDGDEDADAFTRMRQGANNQNRLLFPWGQRRRQTGVGRVRCRSEQLAGRLPPPSGQTRLLAHKIRPKRWHGELFELGEDVLQLVAEALMDETGTDRELRALAATSRSCAKGVRAALDVARRRLNALRLDYLQAEAKVRQVYHEVTADSAEGLEADLERNEAKDAFSRLMHRTGIPHNRVNSILFNAERLSFHDNRSLLGHIADGCELCGAREASRPCRGTNMALHACRACCNKDRVRFDVLWPPDEQGRVKVTIPKAPTVGNTYASAMISRRTAHRRRMAAKRAFTNRPIKLSKRVHRFECTPVLECLVMSCLQAHLPYTHDVRLVHVRIELWHALPHGFENHTFASVLELCENEDDRMRAAHHQAQCRTRRTELVRVEREFKKFLNDNGPLVSAVNAMLRDPDLTDWASWHLAMDLCCAARAFEMRWIFMPRIQFTPGRNWLGNRHDVLKVEEGDRKRMLVRIDIVLSALDVAQKEYALERHKVACTHVLEDFCAGRDRGRKCYLEIAKRMPVAWLSTLDSWVFFQALRSLRRADMRFALLEPVRGVSHQTLTVTIRVDPAIFDNLHDVTLNCSIGKYSCSQIGALVSMPEIEKLTPDLVAKLTQMANACPHALCPLPDNPLRDQARTVLFGLPGAHLTTARKITLTRPT